MTSRMKEIRDNITSDDETVLRHSFLFASKCLKEEMGRGKAAETRATAILAGLVIFAGLTVPLVDKVKSANSAIFPFFCLTFIAFLLFLVKGIYYALKTLGVSVMYRLNPAGTVYGFQPLALKECLRGHISGIIWAYEKAIQPNTNKLFWLNRSQRNSMIAVFLYVLFIGELFFLSEKLLLLMPSYIFYILVALVAFVFFFGDKLFERFSSIWHSRVKTSP